MPLAVPAQTFASLRLAAPILDAVSGEGYATPSPIQAGVIPPAMKGRDILGTAQTGTGKTAAFALPILHRLTTPAEGGPNRSGDGGPRRRRKGPPRGEGRSPRALVLCPTRELAAQIHESFETYGRKLPLRHAVIFGGVGQGRQVTAIRRGLDVLVATPGRLIDLLGQSLVELDRIETVVLDEADRMLDMGFIHDMRRIMAVVPTRRQTMLLSATISPEIRRLADDFLHDPFVVETAPESTTADLIDQRLYLVEKNEKPTLLIRLFEHGDMARTLVFTRTKHGADRLSRVLKKAGVKAEAIHGNKSQGQRTRAMDGFREGSLETLVATDLAARGIDVDGITHVVNYDLPEEPESYVHRIGRTARAGASGFAVSFCDLHEIELLRAIEKRTDARPRIAEDHADLTYDLPADDGRSAARAMKERRTAAQTARSRGGGRRSRTEGSSGERSNPTKPRVKKTGTKKTGAKKSGGTKTGRGRTDANSGTDRRPKTEGGGRRGAGRTRKGGRGQGG